MDEDREQHPQLPVAADWFSLTWVTARTAVITEPHMDDLLRAGLWYLRGRDRDLLVDTGNGVGALAPYLARLARGGRPREIVCVCTHAHIDHIGGFHEFERRLLHPAEQDLATRVRDGAPLAPAMWSRALARPARRERVRAAAGPRRRRPVSPGFDPYTFRPERAAPTHLVRGGDEIDLGDRRLQHRRPAGAHAGQHRARRPRGARPHLRRRRVRRRAHRHAARVGRRDRTCGRWTCCAGSTSTSCTPGTAGRSTGGGCESSPRSTCASAAAERRSAPARRRPGYSSPAAASIVMATQVSSTPTS